MRRFFGFIRGLIYLPFKFFYPTKVLCRYNLPADEHYISVSNHYTWKDIPLIAVNTPGFRHFIAKKEIGKNKLIRKLAIMLGVIFIDREKADMKAIRESVNVLRAGESIAIFPEGTRNKSADTELHEIKGGVTLLAIKGNAPIVPMIIHKHEKIFRKNYLYIGEAFDLSEFNGRMLDGDTIKEASDKVAAHMQKSQSDMEDFIREKRWKSEKKEHKVFIRNQRRMNKKAKKDFAAVIKRDKLTARAQKSAVAK